MRMAAARRMSSTEQRTGLTATIAGGSRTFSLPLPGIGEDSDLIVFQPSLRFVDDEDRRLDFWLETKTWERMGKPWQIKVTVSVP
jgi:hypothetical protein